jgi:hypothetical protein
MSTQLKIYLERSGLLSEKKLTDAEIDKILKQLRIEDEKEAEELNEKYSEVDEFEEIEDLYGDLYEASSGEPVEGKVSSNAKGKLHELLTGYHLNNKKHMEKHPDKFGDSPQEAHDKLKKTVHRNDYKKIDARAKSAANDIRKKVEVNGHKIHQVHWTSQPNDLLRTTGIKATQKQDSSDIVVTTHKK